MKEFVCIDPDTGAEQVIARFEFSEGDSRVRVTYAAEHYRFEFPFEPLLGENRLVGKRDGKPYYDALDKAFRCVPNCYMRTL